MGVVVLTVKKPTASAARISPKPRNELALLFSTMYNRWLQTLFVYCLLLRCKVTLFCWKVPPAPAGNIADWSMNLDSKVGGC